MNMQEHVEAVQFFCYAIELKAILKETTKFDFEGIQNGIRLGIPLKDLFTARANAFLQMGQLNESYEDCNRSLRIDKNNSEPYLILSQIFKEAGNESKSMDCLKVASMLGNNIATSMLMDSKVI